MLGKQYAVHRMPPPSAHLDKEELLGLCGWGLPALGAGSLGAAVVVHCDLLLGQFSTAVAATVPAPPPGAAASHVHSELVAHQVHSELPRPCRTLRNRRPAARLDHVQLQWSIAASASVTVASQFREAVDLHPHTQLTAQQRHLAIEHLATGRWDCAAAACAFAASHSRQTGPVENIKCQQRILLHAPECLRCRSLVLWSLVLFFLRPLHAAARAQLCSSFLVADSDHKHVEEIKLLAFGACPNLIQLDRRQMQLLKHSALLVE